MIPFRPSFADPEAPAVDMAYHNEKLKSKGFSHYSSTPDNNDGFENEEDVHRKLSEVSKKFGTWDGVFSSALLNIFGVIMFLRLGWVVGQAGLGFTIVMIGFALVLTSITTMSMSAICTNGEIGAGGAYYMISRAIGPQVGGAIGILLSTGSSVAVGLYIVGFCETMQQELQDTFDFSITGHPVWDTRVYGIVLLTCLLGIALIGTKWVIQLQKILLALLMFSLISFSIGSCFEKIPEEGFTGWSTDNIRSNFFPDFQDDFNFFSVFAVFFPAATGIMAGANISGDLENPSKNIPRGTFSAIGISMFVYLVLAFILSAVAVRSIDDNYGLINDYLIMAKISFSPVIIFIGIYVASFSSALTSLVGAPRILMSVAKDNLIDQLKVFSKTRANGDPITAYLFTYGIAILCVLIGKLNVIAPLITMFYLTTYGFVNFACFTLSLSKSPGWRPSFRYYNHWLSLSGVVLCVLAMLLTDFMYALVSASMCALIYVYIDKKKLDINWGDVADIHQVDVVFKSLLKLHKLKEDHVKTFRPFYLVLSGNRHDQIDLCFFINSLKHHNRVVFGNVIVSDELVKVSEDTYLIDSVENTTFFYECISSTSVRQGIRCLLQRFKDSWMNQNPSFNTDISVEDYVGIIKDAFSMNLGIMIGRRLDLMSFAIEDNNRSNIHVWWLLDDGGLTILIPWIMSNHTLWKSISNGGTCSIQLFIISREQDSLALGKELAEIILLLNKFRIYWEIPRVFSIRSKIPSQNTLDRYESLPHLPIDKQRSPETTNRWLLIAEKVKEMSIKDRPKLVFVNMPFPHLQDNPEDYMSTLEMLTDTDAPTILIRGNGKNVLTFYSE